MSRSENDRKARQNENFDFITPSEMRQHRRVSSNAFAGIPVVLKPAPPFFGAPVEGKMVDLSGGGTAVLMPEALPVGTKMKIWIAFPHREAVDCRVAIRRVSPADGGYLTGLQFLDMAQDVAAELAKVSADFDACERRIAIDEPPICLADCAFHPLCDKPQRQKPAA